MCISPLKIVTNKRLYREGIDKMFYNVPCGQCYECVQQISNEWFVRISSLYSRWKALNLPVFFLTLSYNPENVPTFGKVIPQILRNSSFPVIRDERFCFNKHHVQQFIKQLRTFVGDNLKYFCVTEYGTDPKGSHHPHYHIILFCPCKLDNYTFLHYCEFCWAESIRKRDVPKRCIEVFDLPQVKAHVIDNRFYRFQHDNKVYFCSQQGSVTRYFVSKGFLMFSSEHGATLQSISGIRYTLKYLHKETTMLSPSYANIKALKDWYRRSSVDDPSITKLRKAVRYSLPFHLQSQGIGLDLVDDLKKLSFNELAKLKKDGISVPGFVTSEPRTFSIPRYVLRKLFYDKVYLEDDNPIYYLNELGKKLVTSCYNDTIKKITENLNRYFLPGIISLVPGLRETVKEKFDVDLDYIINEYHKNELQYKNIYAIYSLVYQDVSTYLVSQDWLDNCGLSFLGEVGEKLFFWKTEYYFETDYTNNQILASFHGAIGHPVSEYAGLANSTVCAKFNDISCFVNFDKVLKINNYIHNSLSELISQEKISYDLVCKVVREANY